jgi:hypothetical protein
MEYRLIHNDENWPDYLDTVIDYYNNRVNRGVGYPPAKLYHDQVMLNYNPVSEFIKLKHETPFPFKVGDDVLALTNKLSFTKGDEGNLTIYQIRKIDGFKIYLEEIMPNGDKVEVKHAFKPYELQIINPKAKEFITSRSVYHTMLERRKSRQERRKLTKQLNDANYGTRQTIMRHIKKCLKEGDIKQAEELLVKYNALTQAKKTIDEVIEKINAYKK